MNSSPDLTKREYRYLERRDVSTDEISVLRLIARCKDENNFELQMENYRDHPSYIDAFDSW